MSDSVKTHDERMITPERLVQLRQLTRYVDSIPNDRVTIPTRELIDLLDLAERAIDGARVSQPRILAPDHIRKFSED